MDDSLERDQLNLWQQLNRLYGDEEADGQSRRREDRDGPEKTPESGADEPAAGEEVEGSLSSPVVEKHENRGNPGSAALEEVDLPESSLPDAQDLRSTVNEVCADCRYHCPQPAGQFIIARCRLATQSRPHHENQTPNQVAASQGAMGIEKINETCRRCSRSCKQRTTKLNRMLCLGFLPLHE